MNETNISWTDRSWNPVFGCSHVSDGCRNCYAESLALRFGHSKKPWKAQFAAENVVLKPHKLKEARKIPAGAKVFVNSMSDLFHEQIPFEYIDQVFAWMAWREDVVFQVLTKRPERMREYFRDQQARDDAIANAMCEVCMSTNGRLCGFGNDDCQLEGMWRVPLPNVWLGVSVEDQRRADERIPILIDTQAAIRFLSVEPMLGPVDLEEWLWEDYCPDFEPCRKEATGALDWVICGGESGPHFRPMEIEWAQALRDACIEAGVAYWFKQTSGRLPGRGEDALGRVIHEFPEGMPV